MKDEPAMIAVPRDLLIKADSYLSLLWYRPSTPHDGDLQLAVTRVITALRTAYEADDKRLTVRRD